MHQTGPASRPFVLATLRALRLDPALTRRCPHGGRKPPKPLVANVLTQPHPFRDDTSDRQHRIAGYEEAMRMPLLRAVS
jgi:hypothetical protein